MSSNTLICLVSEQRMQNVLPLFQEGMHFERIVLLRSHDATGKSNSRFEEIASDLKGALSDHAKWDIWPSTVDPIDLQSTKMVCKEIIDSLPVGEKVTINFTSGTKPMSIGAYLAGVDCQVPLLYVDTQAEQFVRYPKGEHAPSFEPFKLAPIDVETFLKIHGRSVESPSPKDNDFTTLAEKVFAEGTQPASLIRLQQQIKDKKQNNAKEIPIRSDNENKLPVLFSEMKQRGWVRSEGDFIYLSSHSAIPFLTGKWLEEYVAWRLKQSGKFMDVCHCSIKVAEPENELDVACTLNGKLGIIECKSGSVKEQVALTKLKMLRDRLGGVFGKAFLAITIPEAKLHSTLKERAGEYGACIIDKDNFPRVVEIVEQELANRSRQ